MKCVYLYIDRMRERERERERGQHTYTHTHTHTDRRALKYIHTCTDVPSQAPSDVPSDVPSEQPTAMPSEQPTAMPTPSPLFVHPQGSFFELAFFNLSFPPGMVAEYTPIALDARAVTPPAQTPAGQRAPVFAANASLGPVGYPSGSPPTLPFPAPGATLEVPAEALPEGAWVWLYYADPDAAPGTDSLKRMVSANTSAWAAHTEACNTPSGCRNDTTFVAGQVRGRRVVLPGISHLAANSTVTRSRAPCRRPSSASRCVSPASRADPPCLAPRRSSWLCGSTPASPLLWSAPRPAPTPSPSPSCRPAPPKWSAVPSPRTTPRPPQKGPFWSFRTL
jgi:hypothetical protein